MGLNNVQDDRALSSHEYVKDGRTRAASSVGKRQLADTAESNSAQHRSLIRLSEMNRRDRTWLIMVSS